MPFIIWAGKKIYKRLKEGEREAGLTEEERKELENLQDKLYRYNLEVFDKLKQYGLRRGLPVTLYAHLIDPERGDLEVISKVVNSPSPLFARLALKLFGDTLEREIRSRHAYALADFFELYMFLRGVESEEDIIKNPKLMEDFLRAVEEYSQTGRIRVGDVEIEPWRLKDIVPPPYHMILREPQRVKWAYMAVKDLLDKVYQKLLELKEQEELTKAPPPPPPPPLGVAGAVVRELGPPKAVGIILSKLELVCEQAGWMGGVDVRALKKILREVQEGKRIVEEAFGLVKEWERGDKEAFFEGYAALKSLPEDELEGHKLVGDIERIRRKVVAGELEPVDAANIFAAHHTTYSVTESHLTDFLSRIEEHSEVQRGVLRIRPDHLDKHVIQPLKEKLKRIRPIIKGKL